MVIMKHPACIWLITFSAITITGRHDLGGEDIDRELLKLTVAPVLTEYGINIMSEDHDLYQQMLVEVRKAKEALTENTEVSVTGRGWVGRKSFE
jgi:molecular chaperone DnaK (HSP70)